MEIIMLTTYTTGRLELHILNPSMASIVLNFYNRNREFLEPLEPARANNFYTYNYQHASMSYEYNSFIKNKCLRFWLFLKDNTYQTIGSVCFNNFLKGAFCSCMVGYKLDMNYCGHGYMHEALCKLIPIVCSEYAIHRINAMVMPENFPSINLLNKLNFIQEGYLHSYAQINGTWRDHLLYAYLNR